MNRSAGLVYILFISFANGFGYRKTYGTSRPVIRNKLMSMVIDHNYMIDLIDQATPLINAKLSVFSTQGFFTADETVTAVADISDATASAYTKVDKTGFIGFFADGIEKGIDFGHSTLQFVGLQNTYGFSIVIFTFLIKALTLPLTITQLESTTKMQKLQPLQLKIQAKYANDEQTKNQLVAQLFQTANVNPLAGCFPALVQIPVFISLYRALQNLVAENKLDEPFLWIPDLEGPVYTSPSSESLDWVKSIITGSPKLGWHDTLAFLTIPLILYVSQSISSKVLQPPKDPKKALTEQEQFSQGLVNNIPFIIAFFSLNVPAGLAVYWIVNNILTTLVTVAVKAQFKDEQLPVEVVSMMAAIDGDTGAGSATATKRRTPSSVNELRRSSVTEDKPIVAQGFGTVIDAEIVPDAASEGETEDGSEEQDDEEASKEDVTKKSKKSNKKKTSQKKRN